MVRKIRKRETPGNQEIRKTENLKNSQSIKEAVKKEFIRVFIKA